MKKNKQSDKIIKYPKDYQFSIGIVIIGVMFIYMLYHVFSYITADNTTIYEVTLGSISSNLEYNALAIREEQIVYSDKEGMIVYLAGNDERVGVRSSVYALDETGDIVSNFKMNSLSDASIDKSELSNLNTLVNGYTLDYSDQSFNRVYNFKSELSSQIDQIYNLSAMGAMSDEIASAKDSGTFHVYNSPTPGVVLYSSDGFETINLENYNSDSFDSSKVSVTNYKIQDSVLNGQPVYKLITSDKWNLICQIDLSLYNKFLEEQYIKIRFLDDEVETWTKFYVEEKAGKYYMVLSLDDSMERYADQRFVHIKLLDNEIKGLKIPNSSITTKQFYTIPKDYFYQGADSNALGLMVSDGTTNNFVIPTLYYETDDYYYVDGEYLNSGESLIKANSSSRYIVGDEVATLEGVYNVNKGYAVFKQIEILYQNENYSIIKTGTSYGISMYDHIVLQGDLVQENDIIN